MTDVSQLTLRALDTRADYQACVRLQRDTWGDDFTDVVPATILMVSQRVGGISGGAFNADGRLVGFVFGVSGVRDGALSHWSDMLAVPPELRGQGLGKRLKAYQRDALLALGIRRAHWSYDPLVARNANLNLNGLGAVVVDYVVNMYGDTGSTLHIGLDTDRLVVEWRLDSPGVENALANCPAGVPAPAETPVVDRDTPLDALPRSPWLRVTVPADIAPLKRDAPDEARVCQRVVRHAFQTYLAEGYRVAGFEPPKGGPVGCYILTNEREP
jgi:predicted GNAT superfamily acetyltransferase